MPRPLAGYHGQMGLLDSFEQRLEQLVNGSFARAFKAEVQPVEIAAALQREIDDRAAVVSRGRTVVPNVFTIDLSPHDSERLMTYRAPMTLELAELVRTYADEQKYSLSGDIEIAFDSDSELETGIFRVRSEAKAAVTAVPDRPMAAQPPFNAPPPTAPSPSTWSKPGIGAPARLVIRGTAYPLTRATTVLGRGSDVDIRIDDPGVSRRHCEISTAPIATARDLGSTNGTLVNGQRIAEVELTDGAVIQIGSTELVFHTG